MKQVFYCKGGEKQFLLSRVVSLQGLYCWCGQQNGNLQDGRQNEFDFQGGW